MWGKTNEKKICLTSIGILLVFAIVFTVFAPSFASSTGIEIQTSLKETNRNSYYSLVAGSLIASFPKVLIQTEFREKEVIAYPPEYAGAYIDGSNTLHIVLTKYANMTTKLNYLEIMGYDEDIIFDIADFPLYHLYEIQRTLTGAWKEQKFSIERIGINEITNKVEIYPFASTPEKEIKEFLKNKFNDFDVRCITFKDPIGIKPTAVDTASNALAGFDNDSVSNGATLGFNACRYTTGKYEVSLSLIMQQVHQDML